MGTVCSRQHGSPTVLNVMYLASNQTKRGYTSAVKNLLRQLCESSNIYTEIFNNTPFLKKTNKKNTPAPLSLVYVKQEVQNTSLKCAGTHISFGPFYLISFIL